MRYDLKKFLFIGDKEHKVQFYEKAQAAGIIEFIESSEKTQADKPVSIQDLYNAAKILSSFPVVEQEDVLDISPAHEKATEILTLKHREEDCREERRMLLQEIARVGPLGYFSFDEMAKLENLSGHKVQYFCAKKGKADEVESVDSLFYINTDFGLDYFLSLAEEEVTYPEMMEIHLEDSLESLEKREAEAEKSIHDIDERLKVLGKYRELLHEALIVETNGYNLRRAKHNSDNLLEEKIFSCEGWISVSKMEELEELTETLSVHYEEIAIEENDKVPTCLENEGMNRIGEDLVHIYDTPATSDNDPSLWVLGSFAIFFAIIIGDGGYGALFLALAVYLKFRFPNMRGMGKRMMKLSFLLASTCIIWGVMTNSFFGLAFEIDSPVRKAALLNYLSVKKADYHLLQQDEVIKAWAVKFPGIDKLDNGQAVVQTAIKTSKSGKTKLLMIDEFYDNILLEFALLVGVVHIILSLLRYANRNWASIGWAIFLVGGYLYTPAYLNVTSIAHFAFGLDKLATANAGYQMIVGGFSLAMGLAMIQYKLMGLLEIANLIQVFADVLSYLRLYALGLAGGIVSMTINEMAGSMGFVFSVLLIIFGHLVNIVLSLMGGVIHGLRLNFIEWYHYCFDGGGIQFEPLKLLELE
jgi:V/A-type H+-transporting ATPase subunit I